MLDDSLLNNSADFTIVAFYDFYYETKCWFNNKQNNVTEFFISRILLLLYIKPSGNLI